MSSGSSSRSVLLRPVGLVQQTQWLHTLPLGIVKIDKSFIVGESSRTADEAVVSGIVQMAGRLGLQVIAEGVERLDQQAFLRTAGVDAAQGYLHLRPTPAPEFAAWLRRQQRGGDRQGAAVTKLSARRAGVQDRKQRQLT